MRAGRAGIAYLHDACCLHTANRSANGLANPRSDGKHATSPKVACWQDVFRRVSMSMKVPFAAMFLILAGCSGSGGGDTKY